MPGEARPGSPPRHGKSAKPYGAGHRDVKPGYTCHQLRKSESRMTNKINATACNRTRQRIKVLDKRAFSPPRAKPIKPANSTPTVPSIAKPTRIVRNVVIGST